MADKIGLISEKKLVDIAKHESKSIRIAQLLSETDAIFNINEVGRLSPGSNHYDMLAALDADLNKSVSLIKDIALVVESLDSQHRVPEFKGGQNDFVALFPEHYDTTSRTLDLFGVKIQADGYDKTSKRDNQKIKEEVYDHVFSDLGRDFSFSQYKKHLSHVKKMEDVGAPEDDAPLHESLDYITGMVSIDKWAPLYDKTKVISGYYHDLRAGLSDKASRLVTERVYEQHATIYGVTKKSTYITKKDGVDRVSPSHKDDPETINRLLGLVKDIPFIRAIEIDKDDSVVKFHDMLATVKSMNIDVPDAFELKSRRLGNHRASGLHAVKRGDGYESIKEMGYANNELRLIVVDPRAPTSLAHEITHFRDRENDDNRAKIVNHFSEKIDTGMLREILGASQIDYFLSDREVLARLGEIGFLLNKHGYQDGESLSDFTARVTQEEQRLSLSGEVKERGGLDVDKLQYDISLTKNLSDYLSKDNVINQQVYFNMLDWSPDEMSILRDYVHDFFFSPDPTIKQRLQSRIDGGELDYQSKKYQEDHKKAPRKMRALNDDEKIGKALGAIPKGGLSDVYLKGVELRILGDGELVNAIYEHPSRLSRGGGKLASGNLNTSDWKAQLEDYLSLAKVLDPDARPVDALKMAQFAFVYGEVSKFINSNEQPDEIKRQQSLLNTVIPAFGLNGDVDNELISSINKLKRGAPHDIYHLVNRRGDTFTGMKNVVMDMVSVAAEKAEKVSVPKDKIPEVDDLTKLLYLSQTFLAAFSEAELKTPESAHDYWYEMSQSLSFDYAKNMPDDKVSHISKSLSGIGFEEIGASPKLMSHVESSDMDIVKELLSNGILEKYGVDESVVDDFYTALKEQHPDTPQITKGNSAPWTLSDVSEAPLMQKVMSILSDIKSHPARIDPSSLYRKSTSLSTIYNDLGYKGKALGVRASNSNRLYRSSMAPLTVLLQLIKRASADSWPKKQDEVKKLIQNALSKNIDEGLGLGNAVQEVLSKFDTKNRRALLGADTDLKGSAIKSQAPIALLFRELVAKEKALGFPGEGALPTDYYKTVFVGLLTDNIIKQGDAGVLSKFLLVDGFKGVLPEGTRYSDLVAQDMEGFVRKISETAEPPQKLNTKIPSEHYLYDKSQDYIASVQVKFDEFFEMVDAASPKMRAGFVSLIQNLSSPRAGFNTATYDFKIEDDVKRDPLTVNDKLLHEVQTATAIASLPLINNASLFQPKDPLAVKVVREVIPYDQVHLEMLNKDVPKVKEGENMRLENQMRMF